MAGSDTRSDAAQSFFVYVKDPNTGVIQRIAIPGDVQIGLDGAPAELHLLGRLSVAAANYNVDAVNKGTISAQNDDTIVAVNLVVTPKTGRITVLLPASPRDGQLHFIKDMTGTAGTVPIDIFPSPGQVVDNMASRTLSDNYGSLALTWLNGQWRMLVAGLGASGGAGAGTDASFVTMGANASLTNERHLTGSENITVTDQGPKASVILDLSKLIDSSSAGGAHTYATVTVDEYGRVTAISNGTNPPSPNAGYLTIGNEPTLPDHRMISGGLGTTFTDKGAGNTFQVNVDPAVVALLIGSTFKGPVIANGGLTGSLQRTPSGQPYLVGVGSVFITSNSLGQIFISGSGGTGGGGTVTGISGAGGSAVANSGTTYTVSSSIGADAFAKYLLLSSNANDPQARVLTAGSNISIVDHGPGLALTISSTGGGTATTGSLVSRFTPIDSYTTLYWNFDESSAPYASTGTSFLNLTAGSGAVLNSRDGVFNSALGIVSSNGVTSTNTSVGEVTNQITVSCWVYPTAYTGYGIFVLKNYRNDGSWSAPYNAVSIQLDGTNDGAWFPTVSAGGSNYNVPISNGPDKIVLNQWQHLAMTYDGTTGIITAYRNGSIVGTRTITAAAAIDWGTHGPWEVGGNTANTSQNAVALIDDVRVEGTVRSASYIMSMYKNGIGLSDGTVTIPAAGSSGGILTLTSGSSGPAVAYYGFCSSSITWQSNTSWVPVLQNGSYGPQNFTDVVQSGIIRSGSNFIFTQTGLYKFAANFNNYGSGYISLRVSSSYSGTLAQRTHYTQIPLNVESIFQVPSGSQIAVEVATESYGQSPWSTSDPIGGPSPDQENMHTGEISIMLINPVTVVVNQTINPVITASAGLNVLTASLLSTTTLSTAYTTLCSVTSSFTDVEIWAKISGISGGTDTIWTKVQVDNVDVPNLGTFTETINNGSGFGGSVMGRVVGLPTGSHTFSLLAKHGGSNAPTINVPNSVPPHEGATLMVMNLTGSTIIVGTQNNTNYTTTFSSSSLVASALQVTHSLGVQYVNVNVYDDRDTLLIPDYVTANSNNTLTIGLGSFTPLTGTWKTSVISGSPTSGSSSPVAVNSSGPANSRPAAAGSSGIYFCTDIPAAYFDDPVTKKWQQFSSEYLPFQSASYVLCGTSVSLVPYGDTLRFTCGDFSSNSVQALVPSSQLSNTGSWAVTGVASWMPAFGQDYPGIDVCVAGGTTVGSSTTYGMGVAVNGAGVYYHVEYFTVGGSRSSLIAEASGAPIITMFGNGKVRFRLVNDTVNLHYQISNDGFNWSDWWTGTCPTGLTHYGVMMGSSGGSVDYGKSLIHSLRLTTPITYNITGATNASPSVITIGPHSIVPGDIVAIQRSAGNTGINTSTGQGDLAAGVLVKSVTATTITTTANGNGTWTSGGIVTLLTR